MIVYPPSLLTSADPSLKNTRIGWQTWTRSIDATAVTVGGDTEAGPKDAPLRSDTAEYWQMDALPNYWIADFGASVDIGYVGIAGHTLGAEACSVRARVSDDLEFEDYLRLRALDGNYASAPDSAANSVTTDLDLELELAIDNADLPAYFLDFVGDFAASVLKVTGGSPTVGTFTRAGNTATRINSSGLVETVLANVMRQAFDDTTRACKGFLAEEARINYCLRSQEIDNAAWNKRAAITITANSDVAPDGTTTADTITEAGGSSSTEGFYQEVTGAGNTTYTCSLYAKAGTGTACRLLVKNNATDTIIAQALFALTSSWQRISVSGLTAGGTTGVRFEISTNDVVGTIKVWGAQVEAGASASTYIPTTTASVTRAADVATVTDLPSIGFSATEGTLTAGFSYDITANGRVVQFEDATANEHIRIVCNTTTVSSQIIDGGVAVMNTAAITGVTTDAVERVALAYKANDSATAGNGSAVTVDSSVTLPTVTKLSLGHTQGASQLNGYLRTFDYYATRRVDATLQDFSRQTYRCLASKWNETSNQRSWALCLTEHCSLILFVSTDGTAAGIREYHSVPLTVTVGDRFRIRVKLQLAAGSPSLDSTCTFQTSIDDGGSYVTLGTPVVQSSVSAVFNSTAQVEIGSFNGGTSEFEGRLFQFWQRATLGGTITVHFDANDAASEAATSWVSDTSETWTVHATGVTPATISLHAFSTLHSPADGAPIIFLDTEVTKRYLRVDVDGDDDPARIAVINAGPVLAMQMPIRGGGFLPSLFARETVLSQSLSRGGAFLGQSIRRMGIKGNAPFALLTPDWVRDELDPFIREARSYPWFFAWRPETYPLEVGYVVATDDIHPTMQGVGNRMQVSIPYQGLGSDS